MFSGVVNGVKKVLVGMICILLSALVLLVLTSVISRYFLNFSIAWGEELSRFMMIWMVFIGAVVAYGYKEHLGLDIVAKLVPEKVSHVIMIAADILILIALGFIIKGGGMLTKESIDSLSPALEIPYGYVYSIVPVCGTLMLLQTLYNMADRFKRLVSHKAEEGTGL